MGRSRDDDLMAVDLGPAPPPLPLSMPRDERLILEQAQFENNIVRYLLNRYRLREKMLVQLDLPTDQTGNEHLSLVRFCLAFPDFPFFLGALRITKTAREKLTFIRLFSDPFPESILTQMADLVAERDAYNDSRPVGVLVRWAGFDTYREPRTKKGVSVAGCASLLFHARQPDTFEEDLFQPPVMTLAPAGNAGVRLKVQSFASMVYQIDRSAAAIFPGLVSRNAQDD